MAMAAPSDEELLAGRDATSFGLFYGQNVDGVLAYFARRTHDAELAADLTAETFAAALARRRRYRPQAEPARAWLFAIAAREFAGAQRTGRAARRARRRLGMARLELSDGDLLRIRELDEPRARSSAEASVVEIVIGR
jgi:DNA-directed RNA polymerase specialized sigma24 family protein